MSDGGYISFCVYDHDQLELPQSTPEKTLLAAILFRSARDLFGENASVKAEAIAWFEEKQANVYGKDECKNYFTYQNCVEILHLTVTQQKYIEELVTLAKESYGESEEERIACGTSNIPLVKRARYRIGKKNSTVLRKRRNIGYCCPR
jgi:hypothetical protein